MKELPTVLFVDPDPDTVSAYQTAIENRAISRACCDFVTARHVLKEFAPDLVFTNARLAAHNGLHLAYIASALGTRTRCVVYSDGDDPVLAREVQAAGAFFERQSRLLPALGAYLTSQLPPAERRHAFPYDRRQQPRGGRRLSDAYWSDDAASSSAAAQR